MKILVANLGSTSFKYRLFDMRDERQLARGGTERIGAAESRCFVEIDGRRREMTSAVPDHAVAVRLTLEQLTDPGAGCLKSADEVAAIGFKAVHGGRYSGVQRVTSDVLAASGCRTVRWWLRSRPASTRPCPIVTVTMLFPTSGPSSFRFVAGAFTAPATATLRDASLNWSAAATCA
jgi:hypothetical protein